MKNLHKYTAYLFIFRPFFALILGFILLACQKQEGEQAFLGYDYYPLEEGRWIIYQVDSIVYDDFLQETRQYSYQVKEVQEAFFTNSQQNQIMRLERFYRADELSPWQFKNTWTAQRTSGNAQKTEENQTFVKMVFPVKRSQLWNGNAFNHKSSQEYRYIDLHQSFQIPAGVFDSTITVLQKSFTTLISEEYQYEVYAWQEGLIYKKFRNLQKQIDGSITAGVDYSYTLVEKGKDG